MLQRTQCATHCHSAFHSFPLPGRVAAASPTAASAPLCHTPCHTHAHSAPHARTTCLGRAASRARPDHSMTATRASAAWSATRRHMALHGRSGCKRSVGISWEVCMEGHASLVDDRERAASRHKRCARWSLLRCPGPTPTHVHIMADDAKVAALKSYSKVLHEHEKVSGDLKNGALSQRRRKMSC